MDTLKNQHLANLPQLPNELDHNTNSIPSANPNKIIVRNDNLIPLADQELMRRTVPQGWAISNQIGKYPRVASNNPEIPGYPPMKSYIAGKTRGRKPNYVKMQERAL